MHLETPAEDSQVIEWNGMKIENGNRDSNAKRGDFLFCFTFKKHFLFFVKIII